MEPADIAIPILPSRSLENTLSFYRRLGFDGCTAGPGYAIVTRGSLEIHFFLHTEIQPVASFAGCYLRVADVDTLYFAFSEAKLPPHGIPRMDRVEDKPWGMREFAVIDDDGNLLRIGQLLKPDAA
ncbi:VOC family protein [Pseudoduganella ginsengisoli]|uniref:Bleomycin resistance protein n=1 Tax=Pseudoduganella ginsengisoli TaxID=1462440 RepID=A0A6L6Q5S0_9BURK|nr:VOC family protein [Pseudoduganella ginsengisoli]MTW04895.1 VOC family protein [Pseudoduganella ginsengisoli]